MNLWPLRALAFSLNLSAHGVAVTVTRPAPDNTPINTTGIWCSPLDEARAFGRDLLRREPRRVLAMPRADVPTLPRGTTIVAPESTGWSNVTWKVDGLRDPIAPDHWEAILVQ